MTAIHSRPEARARAWLRPIGLRAFGLALLVLCAAGARWLYGSVHQLPAHQATAPEIPFRRGRLPRLGARLGPSRRGPRAVRAHPRSRAASAEHPAVMRRLGGFMLSLCRQAAFHMEA
ncbi:MAG: hypothetical protein WDN24_17775 [Sphingomonas sp.]